MAWHNNQEEPGARCEAAVRPLRAAAPPTARPPVCGANNAAAGAPGAPPVREVPEVCATASPLAPRGSGGWLAAGGRAEGAAHGAAPLAPFVPLLLHGRRRLADRAGGLSADLLLLLRAWCCPLAAAAGCRCGLRAPGWLFRSLSKVQRFIGVTYRPSYLYAPTPTQRAIAQAPTRCDLAGRRPNSASPAPSAAQPRPLKAQPTFSLT